MMKHVQSRYLKHVCYLIDSNILGYKNNGDIYFKLHNKFPNMESSELVNLILEKLITMKHLVVMKKNVIAIMMNILTR